MNPLDSILTIGSKILDKIFPDANTAAQAKADLLRLAQQGQLEGIAAEFKDRDSARILAAADIAGGNSVTRFAAAIVRPLWGLGAFAMVAYALTTGTQISQPVQSIIQTVLEFYFGGRVIEKVAPWLAGAIRK